MHDSVILMVADQHYLDHAKSLMVNCRRQGNWQGDFAMICSGDCDVTHIQNRGIDVLYAQKNSWSNKIKFLIFRRHFTKWKRVLYLDLDCLCQGDLNIACEREAARFPKILTGHHQGTILDDWKHFDPAPDLHPELYAELQAQFPFVTKQIRTSDVMFFDPASIPADATDKMFSVQEEFKDINPGEYDQQVIDLVLYDQMDPIGKDFCTWWAFDEPCNRVASETHGWRGDENPVIVHYWGSFAPWLEKTPDAGAYFNHRLGRVCRDLYCENLNLFDEIFPHV